VLNSSTTSYLRTNVTYTFSAAVYPAAIAAPALGYFTFSAGDRGRTEQVDLVVSIPMLDSDGDGIPDSWMMKYFGHATGLASDKSRAQDDFDGDGMTNWAEYIAGTDPTDAASFFAFTKVVHMGQTTRDALEWYSASNRVYSIYGSPALSVNAVDYSLIASNIVCTPPRNVFTNTTMPSARFYRVQVFK